MLRSIGKQSGESVESVPKKKRKAKVERMCSKGRSATLLLFFLFLANAILLTLTVY